MLDLIVLDLVVSQSESHSPLEPHKDLEEQRSFFFLKRAVGRSGVITSYHLSKRLYRIQEKLLSSPTTTECPLQPVSLFWGRANRKTGSVIRSLVSERFAFTSSFRRVLGTVFSRTDVLVHFNTIINWQEELDVNASVARNLRHIARTLRRSFDQQRLVALGPPLEQRSQVVTHLSLEAGEKSTRRRRKRTAKKMVANLSYPSMRFLKGVLKYFWRHVYDGIELVHLERIEDLAKTHTLVYVPNHRSHVDYLVLSYLLFVHGIAIPHIVAGDNLNRPVIGGILRRCGAFFIRRSFRDDPEYRDLLHSYLKQLMESGTSIEFFIEGTRSRTGWTLDPQMGLLHMLMTVDTIPESRPIALIPTYISHEKLIESASYRRELLGQDKSNESRINPFKSLKFLPNNMGTVVTKFGQPIDLTEFVEKQGAGTDSLTHLSTEVVEQINESVVINPTNLTALAIYSLGEASCNRDELVNRIDFLKTALRGVSLQHDYSLSTLSAAEIVEQSERQRLIQFDQVQLSISVNQKLDLLWFRNNVLHTLVIPGLLAYMVMHYKEPRSSLELIREASGVAPYVMGVFKIPFRIQEVKNWITHLKNLQLVKESFENRVLKSTDPEKQKQLVALCNLAQVPLEAMYVLLFTSVQSADNSLKMDSLIQESLKTLEAIAASNHSLKEEHSFCERRFQRAVINQLLRYQQLKVSEDGCLVATENLPHLYTEVSSVVRSELIDSLKEHWSQD